MRLPQAVGPGFNTPLVAESVDAETLTALNGMHPIGRIDPDSLGRILERRRLGHTDHPCFAAT